MKQLVIAFGMSVFLGIFSTQNARGSQGRGGGQTIDVDSTPTLLSLVTKAVCDYKTGDEILKLVPEFETRILEPLRNLDWYFADDLKIEARSLIYCLTGPLYTENPRDRRSPVKPPAEEGARQAAYRLNEYVYLDKELFFEGKMPGTTQADLLAHEVLHSYIPMRTQDRKLKLRSMDKAIEKVRNGEITTTEDLHFNMRASNLDFPLTVSQLHPHRRAIEFLVAKPDDQEQKMLQREDFDDILRFSYKVVAYLTHWDSVSSRPFSRMRNTKS